MQSRTKLAMELERDPDFVSPKKRKRRCGDDVAGCSKRFPKFSKPLVVVDTKENTDWALTVFRE